MSTLCLLPLALLLDALLGEPRALWSRLPHPAVLMGRVVNTLDTRLNHGTARRLKGLLALALMVLGAWLLGWLLSLLGPLVELILAAILLAHRSLIDHLMAVVRGLRTSTGDGRRAVAMIVGRDTGAMDDPAIIRAAVESGAEFLRRAHSPRLLVPHRRSAGASGLQDHQHRRQHDRPPHPAPRGVRLGRRPL